MFDVLVMLHLQSSCPVEENRIRQRRSLYIGHVDSSIADLNSASKETSASSIFFSCKIIENIKILIYFISVICRTEEYFMFMRAASIMERGSWAEPGETYDQRCVAAGLSTYNWRGGQHDLDSQGILLEH